MTYTFLWQNDVLSSSEDYNLVLFHNEQEPHISYSTNFVQNKNDTTVY